MQDLLADSNPMVVANAVAALADIRETSTRNIFTLNTQSLQKLLRALNECTEWGQVHMSALLTIIANCSQGPAMLGQYCSALHVSADSCKASVLTHSDLQLSCLVMCQCTQNGLPSSCLPASDWKCRCISWMRWPRCR